MTSSGCRSYGMPIDDGIYCEHCTDEDGNLQVFDERFTRMVQWTMRRDGATSREEAERKTFASMATMPAWRDHPKVVAAAERH